MSRADFRGHRGIGTAPLASKLKWFSPFTPEQFLANSAPRGLQAAYVQRELLDFRRHVVISDIITYGRFGRHFLHLDASSLTPAIPVLLLLARRSAKPCHPADQDGELMNPLVVAAASSALAPVGPRGHPRERSRLVCRIRQQIFQESSKASAAPYPSEHKGQ